MIRTTSLVPFFGQLRVDESVPIICATNLTTLRYEPILRANLGFGHLDLLFEVEGRSACVRGVLLDGSHLITRERSPFIWPASVAGVMDSAVLAAIEEAIVPWLRSLARARPMCREAIRRYAPSVRFDRARDADLLGAAPLERAIVAAAPFVYARRFARGERIKLLGSQAFLAWAMLWDIASSVECRSARTGDERFVRDWFGLPDSAPGDPLPHRFVITDDRSTVLPRILIASSSPAESRPALVDIPTPSPWDVVYPFDRADAPVVAQFAVTVAEPFLRKGQPSVALAPAGTSAGTVILALSAEARAMGGDDERDAVALAQRLDREGITATIVTAPAKEQIAQADLVHIFGAPYEPHVLAFAQSARELDVAYMFDLPPFSTDSSRYVEKMLTLIYRSTLDDTDIDRYLGAYRDRSLEGDLAGETSAEEVERRLSAFGSLARGATALVAPPCNMAGLRALVGETIIERSIARGTLAAPLPAAAPIGHLVPSAPFAFIDAVIGSESHALFAALALERAGIPAVVAGAVYDVEYLATLRLAAPDLVVIADPPLEILAALYRSAAFWVDAAAHPRGCSSLVRAVECGALPVLADQSPLVEIVGDAAPVFPLTSIDGAAQVLARVYSGDDSPDRATRLARLAQQLTTLSDPEQSFRAVIAAYARAAVPA